MQSNTNTLHRLIANGSQNMDSVAVEFENGQLTYGELESRSNRLALQLRELGVKPGVLVGIYIERSLEMVIGLLGVMKAGGAYVPLDPAYPASRISYMLEDSGVSLIVTQRSIADSLPDHKAGVLCIEAGELAESDFSDQPLHDVSKPDDLAYVIYTSGSTGRPKGVEIPRHALINFLHSMRECPGISAEDRLLAVTTLSFDIAGLEIYLPLMVGARLIIASRHVASDGAQLARVIEGNQITVMQATPATWRLLLEADWSGREQMRILCGGETLTRDLAECLLPRCTELWNLYGPTETTIWSTVSRVESNSGSVPIGTPIANTEIRILDDNLQPVSDGEPGELFIGGDGLARGYFQREKLTAERFVPNPFDSCEGTRLYRTGDLARFRSDGQLEHLGRVDYQVKIRGFRIELGEIEAALEKQESVRQAVVLAREDVPGEKRLVAYIKPDEAKNASSGQLRKALAVTLPDYMVPGYYVVLSEFPLTLNGKVDRKSLPAPDAQRPELSEEFLAPRNQDEQTLCDIWSEVLRVKKVGVNDDFFDLGGDSLMVAQVASRVRVRFGMDLSPRSLFDNPTVSGLLPALKSSDQSASGAEELPISIVSRDEDIPLTFAQERVWFLHQLNPTNLAYNFICKLEFRGELNVGSVERALEEILRRHESYRTTFPTVNGRPVQVIHPAEKYSLPVIDVSGKSEAVQNDEIDNWCRQEYQHRFDLAQLPLVRWHLIRYSDDRHILVHMEHHLVHDGWSFNLFLREYVVLYEAYSQGHPSPLADPPIQLADFASWQHRWMQGAASDHQLAYWKQKFRTIPPVLQLPMKGPRPATQTFRGTSLRPEIPLELCNGLRDLARKQGSTMFMTMLSGFITLLHRYSGENDVAVGTFFANRRVQESESVIAMILNNVVVRAAMDNNPTVTEVIKQIRDVVLEDAAYQDVPFNRVVEAVEPKRDLSMNPLFQVMFSFHDEPMPEKAFSEVECSITPVISNGSSKFDLGVIGIPHSAQKPGLPQGSDEDGLTMIWEHNTDLFETDTIAQMIEHYITLLTAMVENPDQRISELPLAGATERNQMLRDWNDTGAEYPLSCCLHQLIEQQAAATPDSIAVVFQSTELSYRQLDDQANQLANHLISLGVKPGMLVGICLERSERMLIGLLGILKAGGAYVPIDPTFPTDRQAFMVEDAEISILVTEGNVCDDLPVDAVTLVRLDRDQQKLAGIQNKIHSPPDVCPNDLAYVIYTSGSTGRPKGVQVPHSAVVNFLCTMAERPGISAADRLFAVTTLSFDISGLELFLPLTVGATVIVSPRMVAIDAQALAEQLETTDATVMQATPTTWQMLIDSDWNGMQELTALCGGEAMPRSLAEALLPKVKVLWNMYGPTETTIWSAIHLVESGEGAVPVGRPIGNTNIYVTDHYGHPAPVGVVGELCIGGAGLARGYLKRPQLTKEKFVVRSFDGVDSERIYRTGDLARFRLDGTLECLGRIDQQIKLRGFRIELGEIEAQIERQGGIRQAIAIVREDTPGDKRLIAYYISDDKDPPNLTSLLAALRKSLPNYMIPSAFIELDEFPKTPNGKIDKNALPVTDKLRPELDQVYLAPENDWQASLAEIWTEILGIDKVGIGDSFFDLGGNSLMVIRMIIRIREELGTDVAVGTVFHHPTIADLHHALFQSQLDEIEDQELLRLLDEVEKNDVENS